MNKPKTMPCTHIIAIDPGKANGWATFELSTRSFKSGEGDFDQTCALLRWAVREVGGPLQVLCERFTITPETHKNTPAPWSLEMQGVARYFASMTDCDYILADRSTTKNFAFNGRLKALGWFKGGEGHADDAARVLLHHLVTRRNWWDERLDATLD